MSGTRRCGGRRPERPAVVGDNSNGYVETDPTGRYGRFDELLGKGAMKSVYRGFDEERGVEVAWNQASLRDVCRTPDAVERMYSEVQLLSTLRHHAIIGFHASWVDVRRSSFNFITELFSSGTLRSYRLRYPRVGLRAVRSWARQILQGLAYLHAHNVIHRDLKCDNILVHGHTGQVKIGDLGLAAVLRETTSTAHSVIGTPEFMAPEMYDEEYDQLVDVYSFGMCMLEMLTLEFPYAECSNPAQIYKKVTAGKLPDAFIHRLKDDEARRFIGRCLVPASKRPSAAELLLDPFLLQDVDDHHACTLPSPRRPLQPADDHVPFTSSNADSDTTTTTETSASSLSEEPPPSARSSDNMMTITGKLNAEEDTIFLKVQIADDAETAGPVRNIYFPFDLANDTATEVAREMVKELDITDQDASEIAAMIEQEIDRLLPGREQHEYSYGPRDDDENEEQIPPPFYYLSSSPTSSQGSSLCGVGPWSSSGGFSSGQHGGGWSKDHYCYALSDDDDMSSMHSGKYSALLYDTSGHQEEGAQVPAEEKQAGAGPSSSSSTKAGQAKNTRFGPGETSSSRSPRRGAETAAHLRSNNNKQELLQRQCSMSPHAGRPRRRDGEDERRGRLSRNRSMVDMRSQLLHRTLVEELNRRLFFNTVAAVENIGFRAPPGYGSSSSTTSRGRGRADDHRRRSTRDDKDRYYML